MSRSGSIIAMRISLLMPISLALGITSVLAIALTKVYRADVAWLNPEEPPLQAAFLLRYSVRLIDSDSSDEYTRQESRRSRRRCRWVDYCRPHRGGT